jgi:hypothetical protein
MNPARPARFTLSRARARRYAWVAIAITVSLEILSGTFCEHRDLQSQVIALGFLLIPLSPALIAVLTPNPLCAVAATIPVAGWILYAFYLECVNPSPGNGASMVYIGVWFYGFLCAGAAALISVPLYRLLGLRVAAD